MTSQDDAPRKGAFIVLGFCCLAVCLGFVAFSVDLGMISLTRTQMQNSVDAAALAAAMEITNAVQTAPQGTEDITVYARAEAKNVAVEVAELNGFYVDPASDVIFGQRTFDDESEEFVTNWDIGANDPANVVKVRARKDNADLSAPDGKLRLFFAGIFGDNTASLWTEAIAYVEARDLVVVHDFSRSMNFDSYFCDEAAQRLTQQQIEDNLALIWQDLGMPTYGSNMGFEPGWFQREKGSSSHKTKVRWEKSEIDVLSSDDPINRVVLYFTNGSYQAFSVSGNPTTGSWSGTGSNSGRTIAKVDVRRRYNDANYTLTWDFYDDDEIIAGLGLSGDPYPWSNPGGSNDDGTYGRNQGSWGEYIRACRGYRSGDNYRSPTDGEIEDAGYGFKFGLMTFYHYQLKNYSSHDQFPVLWQARHYPFHAIKAGHSLLCDFLEDLGFDDHIGMVSYDTYHRLEDSLNEHGVSIDLTDEPLSTRYDDVKTIMNHKQAFHYFASTNIGGGMEDAIDVLEEHGRPGARPNILLMTDGNANVYESGFSLPGDWNTWFDGYDGPGTTYNIYHDNPSNSEVYARAYLFAKVNEAVQNGYTIHTMAVGADADWKTMKAIAHYGNGEFIHVDGGSSVEQMEAQVMAAFHRIAGKVPPAKLLAPDIQ